MMKSSFTEVVYGQLFNIQRIVVEGESGQRIKSAKVLDSHHLLIRMNFWKYPVVI